MFSSARLNSVTRCSTLLLFILIVLTSKAKALELDSQEYSLDLKPQECVSLYKGQRCHLSLEFEFSAPQKGNYCIVSKVDNQIIHCWLSLSTGTYSQDFDTDKDVIFELRNKLDNQHVFASTTLSLSWVYKASNKKRLAWRLF